MAFCPDSHTGAYGLDCGSANTFTQPSLFRIAYSSMYMQERKECRDRDDDIIKRSRIWYGQEPESYLKVHILF
jgi:hypothetical protein